MTPSFNLISRPWIRTRETGGDIVELSLLEVFDRAHKCTRLAGDLPTQDAAVLRLLLAILRRSHPEARETHDWKKLWHAGRFETASIAAYLDRHRRRFDLLHAETPFYQVAGLRTAKDAMTELGRLVADVPAGHQFFTTRAGAALETMPFAEAARWIVHCQAFDPSGIKSGAVGDDRVKGGRGYPIGVAWCGWLGMVVVEGTTLFETLLLNLPLGAELIDPADDLPAWERHPHTAATDGRSWPDGPSDLLTWQSRRIRLEHDGKRATGVLIANGDPLHPRNRFHEEYMTSWRLSQAQMKALGSNDPVFMPREHRPDQAVWRGLAGLLAESREAGDPRTGKPGRWLVWLGDLMDDGVLPRDLPVRARAVGMHYGSQSSVINDIAADSLAMRLEVLRDPALRRKAIDGVRAADSAVHVLRGLAQELAEAAGSDSGVDSARLPASEEAYGVLDQPYRQWLSHLSADNAVEAAELWQREVHCIIRLLGDALVRSAGPASWIGREVSRGPDRTVYLDAAIAENGFRHRLRDSLPLAQAPSTEGATT